jgi:hypothetical protein
MMDPVFQVSKSVIENHLWHLPVSDQKDAVDTAGRRNCFAGQTNRLLRHF